MKLNGALIKSAVVAALGGLMFGFDTAVISGTIGGLTQAYRLTPVTVGVTVASALMGLDLLSGIPLFRRIGHWSCFSFGADVHCGNCSAEVARPPGRAVPGQSRIRHPAGLLLQLPNHADADRR